MRYLHCTPVCCATLLCLLLSGRTLAADSWSYEASPFLWAAGIDGREGPGNLATHVDASFDDLIKFVDVGASLRFVARRPPVGWFAEASYVSLKDDVTLPTGSTVRFTTGGSYRWGERWGVYAAYRLLDTDYEHGGFVYDIRQAGMLFGFGFRF